MSAPRDLGKILNGCVISLILIAVVADILASEPIIADEHGAVLKAISFACGSLFFVEFVWRFCVAPSVHPELSPARARFKFIASPLGILDIVVIAATLGPIVAPGVAVLRLARLLRLLVVIRLGHFSIALRRLASAIVDRRFELYVTMALAAILLLFGATALHLAEGEVQPEKFGSIPRALWWSIITLTTVGYGDVSPITPLGKFLASFIALAGIGMVAMPAGIMAAAFSDAMRSRETRDEQ